MAQNKIDMSLDDIIRMQPGQKQMNVKNYPGFMNNNNNVYTHSGLKKFHSPYTRGMQTGNNFKYQQRSQQGGITPFNRQQNGHFKYQQRSQKFSQQNGVSPLLRLGQTTTNSHQAIQNKLRRQIQQNRNKQLTQNTNRVVVQTVVNQGQQKKTVQNMIRRKIQENQQRLQGGFTQQQKFRSNQQQQYRKNNNQQQMYRKQKLGVKTRDLEQLAHRSAILAERAMQRMLRLEQQISARDGLVTAARNKKGQGNQYQPIARNLMASDFDNDLDDVATGVTSWNGEHINDNLTVSVPNSPQGSAPQTPRQGKWKRNGMKRTSSMASINSTIQSAANILAQYPQAQPKVMNKRARIAAVFPSQSPGQSLHERFSQQPTFTNNNKRSVFL